MAIYAKRGFPVQRDLSRLDIKKIVQEERPVAEKKTVKTIIKKKEDEVVAEETNK